MKHPLEWAATHLKKPGYFCALQIIAGLVSAKAAGILLSHVQALGHVAADPVGHGSGGAILARAIFALGSRSRAIEWRYRGRSLGGGGYWYASHDHAWRWDHSDAEISKRARGVLRWKIRYDSIRVTAEKGQVTLLGEVNWDLDREAAEQTVRKLSGVVSVTNLLTTKVCAVRHA